MGFLSDFLLCLPGLGLLGLCLIPNGRPQIRAYTETWLDRAVLKQLDTVLKVQNWRCTPLDLLAKASAATVSIEGYLIGLPLLFLCGFEDEACLLATALFLTTHVSCALKDLLCGPRPAHACQHAAASKQELKDSKPAVKVMEAARDIEFGCPSMHVALVLVMNGYAVHLLLQYAHADQFPGAFSFYVLEMVQAAAMAWVGVIAWGRLYLGVHSPVDLGLGAVVGMALLSLWVVVGQTWLAYIKMSPWAFGLHFLGCVWLMAAYPEPPIHTSSYTFTNVFCGAELGVAGPLSAAFWVSPIPRLIQQVVQAAPPQAIVIMSRMAAGADQTWLLYRLAGGVTAVLLARSLSKAVLVPLLPALLRCIPSRIRAAWQPPVSVEYTSIGEWKQRKAPPPDASAEPKKEQRKRPSDLRKERKHAATAAQSEPLDMGTHDSDLKLDSSKFRDGGVLLNLNGYPWDADVVRRVCSYFCAVASLVVYVRSLQFAAAMTASS
mmetsp:Transcript_4993/g.13555  ORF Transcript_4993/g.13555 Transcript_4993/m.13555 type:complete len:492 (+) Transcript_4993:1444-2919(+)